MTTKIDEKKLSVFEKKIFRLKKNEGKFEIRTNEEFKNL